MTYYEKYLKDVERDKTIMEAALQTRGLIDSVVMRNLNSSMPYPRSVGYSYFNQNRKYVIEACQKLIGMLQNDLAETV